MEELKKWAPYIGILVGIATMFFLYHQHVREENKNALEIELMKTQLADLKGKQV